MFKRGSIFFLSLLVLSLQALSFAETAFDLEPIFVSKSKNHLSKIFSRTEQDFSKISPQTYLEELSRYPIDLQTRGSKGIQTDFSLRGSGYQGVLMLLEGQRINDPQTGHHNADIPLTIFDLERIDVMPGASSSLFGPDAIAGALNFKIKKPKAKDNFLSLGLGSHQGRNGSLSLSEKFKDATFRFSFEKEKNKGFYYDTDYDRSATTFTSSLPLPDGEFNIYAGYLQKKFGAYDFYTPGLGYPSYEETRTYIVNSAAELEKNQLIIKPNFLWRRHYDKFVLDKTGKRSLSVNYHRTDMFTPSLYFQGINSSLGKTGLGFEYGQQRITSTNLNNHDRRHGSIYFDHSKDISDRAILSDSLRYDSVTGFANFVTGSLNLKFKATDSASLNLGVSRNARIPTFTELYYSDPTTNGDTDLSEEKTLGYSIGGDFATEKTSYGLEFFLRQEKDMIDWVKHSPAQAKWQAENISQGRVFGLEGYYKIKLNNKLAFESNYTYTDKEMKDAGLLYKYGPNYASHLANADLVLDLPCGIQNLTFLYKKKTGRDGWFLFNAYLSANLNKNSSVFLKINNILNVEYQDIEGIPQPGRWFEGGVKFSW